MKNLILISILLLSVPAWSLPKEPMTGFGFIIGSPSALTAKHWMSEKHAIAAGLSFALNDYVLLYGDYLFHFPQAFGSQQNEFLNHLSPYVGAGGVVAFNTKAQSTRSAYFGKEKGEIGVGVRVPLGVEWLTGNPEPKSPAFGVFLELTPGFALAPATDGFFQGGVGVRIYF